MRNRTAFVLAGVSIAFAGSLVLLSGNHSNLTTPPPAGAATLADTETPVRLPKPTTATVVQTLSVPVTVVRTSGAPVQVLPVQRIEVTRVVTLPPVTVTATPAPVTSSSGAATPTPETTTPAP